MSANGIRFAQSFCTHRLRCALACSTSRSVSSWWILRTSFQINIHRSASLAFGPTHFNFSAPKPIDDSFVVHRCCGWTDNPSEETKESRQLCLLDSALHPKVQHPNYHLKAFLCRHCGPGGMTDLLLPVLCLLLLVTQLFVKSYSVPLLAHCYHQPRHRCSSSVLPIMLIILPDPP